MEGSINKTSKEWEEKIDSALEGKSKSLVKRENGDREEGGTVLSQEKAGPSNSTLFRKKTGISESGGRQGLLRRQFSQTIKA